MFQSFSAGRKSLRNSHTRKLERLSQGSKKCEPRKLEGCQLDNYHPPKLRH